MRVCILGERGMLGHVLAKYFQEKGVTVLTVDGRWSSKFKDSIKKINCDFIVNCIAAIPQKSANFEINYELPIWLDQNCKCKGIILPGTDIGPDTEYGKSKGMAKDYVLTLSKHTKIIECSIIGPELVGASSLMQWFLNSEAAVYGYTDTYWNGITSLEWSKIAYQLIENWDSSSTIIKPFTDRVTKMQLLLHIKDVWNVAVEVVPESCASGSFLPPVGETITKPIKAQLVELKNFYGT